MTPIDLSNTTIMESRNMDQRHEVADAWKSYHRKESEDVGAVASSSSLKVYQRTIIRACTAEIESRLDQKQVVMLWSAGSGIDIISLILKNAFKDRLSVTVFDISPDCIARNKEMFSRNGVEAEFVVGDLFASAYSERFDIVMNTGLLEHFDKHDQGTLLQVFSKSLVKGGIYLTVTPFAGAKLYEYCKRRAVEKGSWPYGPENAISTMKDISAEGFRLTEERQVGATDQLAMVKHAFPRMKGALGYLADMAESVSPVLDPALKPFIGGYALFDRFVKD